MGSPDLLSIAAADARKYGLGQWFVRQIQQESGFNPGARSSAGAEGIAQFMPGTARAVGLADPFDPVASLDAAARFDAQLVHRYGSAERALSAYNSGRPDAYQDPGFAGGQTYRYVRSILGGKTGGGAAKVASSSALPTAAAAPGQSSNGAYVSGILSALTPTGQIGDAGALVQALLGRTPQATPSRTPAPAGGGGGIAELLKEGTGGPTHSTGPHVHAAFTSPQLELAAIGYAKQLGLHVGENPYVGDAVDPVHAAHSYHKIDFPGLYNGRKLGEAIDVSGPQEDAFYGWLAKRRGGR